MYTVVSHRTDPLYIHHIPIGLLETIKENRGQVIRDSMYQHVRGFFYFLWRGAELDNLCLCKPTMGALTYHNLQDRVATIKFIATGHAGTTQPMQEQHSPCRTIALQKINKTRH